MAGQYKAVNADEVDRLTASDDFVHKTKCGCGVPIHTFRYPGETLEGRIRPCNNRDRNDRACTAEIEYPMVGGKMGKVAVRLTKRLRAVVVKNHLWGQVVRITYKGSLATKFGHSEKLYLVEKEKNFSMEGIPDGDSRKSNKPRPKRKISRPAAA